jgi:hypothetical protein
VLKLEPQLLDIEDDEFNLIDSRESAETFIISAVPPASPGFNLIDYPDVVR